MSPARRLAPQAEPVARGGTVTLRSLHLGQMRFHGPSDKKGLPQARHMRERTLGPPFAAMAAVRREARAAALSRLTIRAQRSEQYFLRPSGMGLPQPGR